MDKHVVTILPARQSVGSTHLCIDGELVVVPNDQLKQARQQLGLHSDTRLLGATRLLEFDSGYGVVRIPLPGKQVVTAFEGSGGERFYGVVTLDALSYYLNPV